MTSKMPEPGAEWLEADGLGGFSSGTVGLVRTRRYHALLLPAQTPPTGRMVLVNGFDAWVTSPSGTFALSSHRYAPDVLHPDGARRIESFTADPWPRWRFRLEDGTLIEHEIVALHDAPVVALSWKTTVPCPGIVLHVRPLLSGRDYHALHHENPGFNFEPETREGCVVWRPYAGVPGVIALTNGLYAHEPCWYRNFLYEAERARGLDDTEDLASPGVLTFDLGRGEAALVLAADDERSTALTATSGNAAGLLAHVRTSEGSRRRPERLPTRLHSAGDSYLVRRGRGTTIVAGYPWFCDWGRDTFIALRGLCIAAGRLDEARSILVEWAGAVSRGMLPNRFPDRGDEPEFNSVDASLWYVVAVHDYLEAMVAHNRPVPAADRDLLRAAIEAILTGYAQGTRFNIHADEDGLLAAGEPGVQLTWMDAKVGDWVVTPRIGKPVEVEALWLNALAIGGESSGRWKALHARALESFRRRFLNEREGYLYDVVDVDHRRGALDTSFRPNQIFAIGGLPFPLLEGEVAARIVGAVERRLLTPLGLRSLDPMAPGYVPRYEGGVRERDGAYHQGTVWPWLMGPFVEAWVRVRGGTGAAKQEARSRFLEPLLRHLDEAGLGHISEIADGEAPHTPRGCPFQAWSVGEALRLEHVVLAGRTTSAEAPSPGKGTASRPPGAGARAQQPVTARRAASPRGRRGARGTAPV